MSSVQIFHRDAEGNQSLIGVIDGDLIKAHSAAIRDMIATRPADIIHRITLRGPTAEGLRTVIDRIQAIRKGEILEITINTRDIVKAIDIHRAVNCLKIEPPQTKIEGHLNGFLSHQLVTPAEMIAVHNSYGAHDNPHNKIWRTMVHTIAYKWVGGDIPEHVANALKEASLRYPDLDAALDKRVNELLKIKKRQREATEKRAAKRAAKDNAQ